MPHSGKTSRGRTYVRLTLAERFWPKVNKDGPVVRPEIRQLAAAGETLRSIAARFDVSDTLIGYVVKRKFWRHVA